MKVKQISLHKNQVVRQGCPIPLVLCVFCTCLQTVQAQETGKGFGQSPAQVRLGAQSAPERGAYRTAIIITMPSGSHTYWKDPGDAGVPPVFAFDGSVNIAKTDVLFPVPTRLKEDRLEAFGYTDRVAFPILVTPTDPGKPAVLHLNMDYAVCNKICMPGHAVSELALPPKATEDDGIVAAAFSAIPQPLPPARDDQLTVTPLTGAKPSWTLAWSGEPFLTDIFADSSEGYAFDTRRERPGTWTLVAEQVVAASGKTHVPVTLTLAGIDSSFETVRFLDLPATRP